jgi:hypothetical protein
MYWMRKSMALLSKAGMLGVAGLMVSCSGGFGSADYFPTEKGTTWQYVLTYELPEENSPASKRQESLSLTAVGEKPVYFPENKKVSYPVRQSGQGTDYYIDEKDDGYYRVAKRLVVEVKPKPDAKPLLILPKGKNLRVGYTWSALGGPYTVQWQPPFTEMNASIKPFDLLYEIAGLNETVETPAGKFEKCVKVEAFGRMTVYADPRTGYKEVDVVHREWYAPGVGLVKLEREEPVELNIIKGGKLTMVLTRLEL